MKYKLQDIFLGIKNLILWAPTIYRLRYWDYGYFNPLMQKQLSLMIHNFETDSIKWVKVDKEIRSMKIILKILKRLESGDFYSQLYDELDLANEDYFKLIDGVQHFQSSDNFKRWCKKSNALQDIYKRLLIRKLTKDLESWWW